MNILKKAAGQKIAHDQNSKLKIHNSTFLEWGALVLLVLFVPLLLVSNARIAATDEVQYYVYLTSLRFDGDFDFRNDYARLAALNPNANIDVLLRPDRVREKTGLIGNIAPVGSAILWSPFFLLADLFVHLANALGAHIPADGFAWPYIRAVCYGSAVYGLLGLLLCYNLARRYASAWASSLATLTIWLATPLVFYMFVQMGFAHANGFFLVSLFVWVWVGGRGPGAKTKQSSAEPRTENREPRTENREPRTENRDYALHTTQHALRAPYQRWIALGIIGGLMTITREQLGLFLLLPATEAIGEYWRWLGIGRHEASRDNGQRTITFRSLLSRHTVFLAFFVLTLIPQLATYQILNGSPRPASEVGGKFNLCSPHAIDTLIDYNPAPSAWCGVANDPAVSFPAFAHGAFVWAPVLPLALLGMLLAWRRDRLLAGTLLLAGAAQVYVNGAFGTTWHLTGSFGFRRLIECSPIFILGLAFGLDWLGKWLDWRVLGIIAFGFIAWNFGLIANWTVLHPELRRGLAWPEVWQWQFQLPSRLIGTIRSLIFDRCSVMKNSC